MICGKSTNFQHVLADIFFSDILPNRVCVCGPGKHYVMVTKFWGHFLVPI